MIKNSSDEEISDNDSSNDDSYDDDSDYDVDELRNKVLYPEAFLWNVINPVR